MDCGQLNLAMINPTDIEAADEVATMTGLPVTRCGMKQRVFTELMRKYYGTTAARMAESLGGKARPFPPNGKWERVAPAAQ